jgi:hypothetical protein
LDCFKTFVCNAISHLIRLKAFLRLLIAIPHMLACLFLPLS